jgi:lathosterol oxidase
MEYFLELADDYVFDKAYASLLPAASFLPSLPDATSHLISHVSRPSAASSSSISSSLLQYIPHPSLPATLSLADAASTSAWPRDYMPRQFLSLVLMVYLGIHLMYFSMAGLSYYFIFNHDMKNHPRYLKDQVSKEIKHSLSAFPWLVLMTVPWFVIEVRGGGMFYDEISEYGWAYAALSVVMFLTFTDFGIYWVHRIEHHPAIYKHVHKPHHKWIGESAAIPHLSEPAAD